MRDFNQCHVGPHVQFFGKAFMKRWNFRPYTCGNKPVVFFGVNGQHELINNHKGPKIIITSGPEDLLDWDIVKNRKNLFLLSSVDKLNEPIPSDVIFKREMIEMRDFSMFKPNVLGNKIYAYTGTHTWDVNHYLKNDLQKYLPYELIYKTHNSVNDYYDLKYLKENYYDKSFMCINLQPGFGMTTVRELALMGRKVAMNPINYTHSFGKACLSFELNHPNKGLIKVIEKEAKKIGTIQPSINLHTLIDDRWLYMDYYKQTQIKPYKNKNTMIDKTADIHALAYIEPNVEIGANTKIGPFCIIRSGAKIGSDCKFTAYCEIRENVIIGNGTTMGSRCTISANATIGEKTTIKYGFVLTDTPNLKDGGFKSVKGIGDNVLIGANVTLMPSFSIGDNSIIGACSQVRADVPSDEIWYGSPAKFYKKND